MAERVHRRRGETRPDLLTAEEIVNVTTIYGGEENNRQERGKARKFLVEPAYVRIGAGVTKNMGDYESLRVDVAISMPVYAEEVDNAVIAISDKVSDILDREVELYMGK